MRALVHHRSNANAAKTNKQNARKAQHGWWTKRIGLFYFLNMKFNSWKLPTQWPFLFQLCFASDLPISRNHRLLSHSVWFQCRSPNLHGTFLSHAAHTIALVFCCCCVFLRSLIGGGHYMRSTTQHKQMNATATVLTNADCFHQMEFIWRFVFVYLCKRIMWSILNLYVCVCPGWIVQRGFRCCRIHFPNWIPFFGFQFQFKLKRNKWTNRRTSELHFPLPKLEFIKFVAKNSGLGSNFMGNFLAKKTTEWVSYCCEAIENFSHENIMLYFAYWHGW